MRAAPRDAPRARCPARVDAPPASLPCPLDALPRMPSAAGCRARSVACAAVTTFERPAPDITKIVEAWRTWEAGGEALPGRTMADLKIGGADRVLEKLSGEAEQISQAFEAWTEWEKGRTNPEQALAALAAGGFAEIVAALSDEP